MTRFHREGFLEEHVLFHLGFYPWGCMICKRRLHMRTRGPVQQKTSHNYMPTFYPLREPLRAHK